MSAHRLKPSDYAGRTQHTRGLRRPRPITRLLVACLVSLCAFVLTAAGLLYHDLNRSVKSTKKADVLLSRTPAPTDNFSGRALNILLIGSDSRANGNEASSLTNNDDVTQRSDTTMLMHISKDRSRVDIVSLPRDMLVDIPRCDRSDGSYLRPHPNTQFNAAFSLGGGEKGDIDAAMACTWKTIEQFSGLKIDEAIIVDFNGFIAMIDALGGINVYVANAINDPRNTGLVTEPGCKKFNGTQALQYARVRHGVKGGDGGDMQRINRQQEVIGIMVREAMRKNLFTSLSQLYQFTRNGLRALTVSSGLSSVSTLSGLAWSLHGIKPENITFINLPVVEDGHQLYRLQIYKKQAELIWAALQADQPLPPGFEVRDGTGNTFVIPDSSASPDPSSSPSASGASSGSGSGSSSASPSPQASSPASSETKPPLPSDAPTVNSTNTINHPEDPDEKQKLIDLQAKCEAQ